MEDARFNVFWFLSLLAPAAIMLIGSLGHRLWQSLIAGGLSVYLTYWLCLLAVTRKWDMRLAQATTEAQRQLVFDSDGGNQAFTAVITGPLEAVIYTVLWGVVGWKLVSRHRLRSAHTCDR
jgi:hypothetical protein